jgi:long-chain acyl-CoA synthetase
VKRPLEGAEEIAERFLQFIARLNEFGHVRVKDYATHLCQSMLYHAAPLDCAFGALHLGLRIVLVDQWRPEDILQSIEFHAVNTTVMVPAMFVRLCKLPEYTRKQYSAKSLGIVYHGSAPCPIEVKRQMIEWWGPILHEVYGTSEGGGTGITSEEWLAHPGSVGRPHPGASIKILDEAGKELPAGAEGGIYIRPYTGDRFEYLGDPEKTSAVFRGDYFTAGDVGYVDDDGYLYICDRRVDMILTSGVNVYSAEVERVLVLHPSVVDCAVFGVPDAITGQSVLAVIETVSGCEAGPELRSDIMRFLTGRLSPIKLPRRIEFIDSLQRDPAGKLFKRRLRDPYWTEQAGVT